MSVLVTMANYWIARGWSVTMVTLAAADAPPSFALDPAVAPGVEFPAFGGLTYFEVITIAREIAQDAALRALVHSLHGADPGRPNVATALKALAS